MKLHRLCEATAHVFVTAQPVPNRRRSLCEAEGARSGLRSFRSSSDWEAMKDYRQLIPESPKLCHTESSQTGEFLELRNLIPLMPPQSLSNLNSETDVALCERLRLPLSPLDGYAMGRRLGAMKWRASCQSASGGHTPTGGMRPGSASPGGPGSCLCRVPERPGEAGVAGYQYEPNPGRSRSAREPGVPGSKWLSVRARSTSSAYKVLTGPLEGDVQRAVGGGAGHAQLYLSL
jgi:hypothetical protein